MAKKEIEKKEDAATKAMEGVTNYMQLSKLLFSGGDDCPFEINEIQDSSPFYKTARELCDEMGIDWKKMAHEDSNRIMLALLEEYYQRMRESEDEHVVLKISAVAVKVENEKKNGKDTEDIE